MNPVRIAARGMLASMFVVGGLDAVRHPQGRAEVASPVIKQLRGYVPALPDDDVQLVRINGAVHLVAGTTLALGKFQRVSALALAATLVPTTAGGHRFWEHDDAGMKANQRVHFIKNVSMMGGLLFAAMDRKGKPSLGYRANRSAKAASKQAKSARKAAKKQAKSLTS